MKRNGTKVASETETAVTERPIGNASESALNANAGQEIRWPIVRLAAEWGVSEPTLYRILVGAGLDGSKGFEIIGAAKLAVTHFREKAEANARVGDEAATRKKVADADHAEMDFMVAARKLMSIDEGRRWMESVFVTAREKIRMLDGLTSDQKNAVCELLATAVPHPDEAGNA